VPSSISGRKRAGSVSSCSRNTPSAVILPFAWRSALHETPMPTGQRRAVARQPDHAHVVAEVLAAELRADAVLARDLEHLLLELEVAEGAAVRCCRWSAACRGSAHSRA
jgi:hypothetical protein